MSSNNRNVAASLDLFDSVEDALVAIKSFQQSIRHVKLRLQLTSSHSYHIVYHIDGRDVASSQSSKARADHIIDAARQQCVSMQNCTEPVMVQDVYRGRCRPVSVG